jgi:hypothetical protein
MTDEPICCMVIAPRSDAELAQVARDEHAKEFPHGTHPTYWTTARGAKHAALISRLPGSEGSDWTLAEIISKSVGNDPVYTLWLDPERSKIVEWRKGKQTGELEEPPAAFARSLGFAIDDVAAPYTRPAVRMVAVVDASAEEVRRVLPDYAAELRITTGPAGTIVSLPDGDLGGWEVSSALPDATVYHVEHRLDPDIFNVLVLRAEAIVGAFRIPEVEDDDAVSDILGASTRQGVLARLGIDPALLGY